MKKKLLFFALAALILFFGAWLLQRSAAGTNILWNLSQGGTWLLPLVISASLIDSINPCAFSVLLLTIAFLLSIGKLRASIVKIGLVYILGIFMVYMLIGLGLLQMLHLFDTPHFMAKVGATLLIVLGVINVINILWPKFPLKLKIPHASHRVIAELMERSTIPAAFLLGALVGLCEFPCTGGPYLMVLGLLHDSATYGSGLSYLVLYNFIFVLPLLFILAIAGNPLVVQRIQSWQQSEKKHLRLAIGIVMILLGIFIFFL